MTDPAVPAQSAPEASAPETPGRRAGAAAEFVWHLGWAAAVLAAGAALVALFGGTVLATTAALACAAAPGVVGYLWRPAGEGRRLLLVLWAVAVVLAVSLAGGPGGPLGAWCVLPLVAGALLGAPAEGAALSAAALAASILVGLSGAAGLAPDGSFGVGVSVAGVLILGGAAAAAFALLARRWAAGQAAERARLAALLDQAKAAGAGETARAAALARKLKTTELARNRAFNRLAAQVAAPFPSPASSPAAPAAGDADLPRLHAELAAREGELAQAAEMLSALEAELAAMTRARAAAEKARDAAEANAVGRSRFLANMSHELRTPLNAIMGFADIMRSRLFGDLPPKYAEYGELIHEAGRHLMDLINDVLDMSKIEAERYKLTLERFDARDAVNAALRLVRLQADEAGVQLRGVLPSAPLAVLADRRALKQMVLNLVSNALKFTPRGGSVTVTAKAAAGAFELVVADTGVGIAKEDLERLGKPFEQAGDAERRAQGTGLGLSLVKALAGLHGGEMSIESELGEGAAVTVRLPALVELQPTGDQAGDSDEARPNPPQAERSRTGQVIPLMR